MERAPRSVDEWKQALRAALRDAMRAREPAAVAVLRETLAAIDNAEAADLSAAPPAALGVIAGGVPGLGAGDVPRVVLTDAAVTALVERELQERRDAAATLASLGRHEEAGVLLRQAGVLASLR